MVLDEKRLLAILHEPDKDIRPATIAEIKDLVSANLASGEIETRQLWRNFFSSIAIPERKNPELQRRCLPQRYWNYLVETPAGDNHGREH
jgi:probable DNA metabolism protein